MNLKLKGLLYGVVLAPLASVALTVNVSNDDINESLTFGFDLTSIGEETYTCEITNVPNIYFSGLTEVGTYYQETSIDITCEGNHPLNIAIIGDEGDGVETEGVWGSAFSNADSHHAYVAFMVDNLPNGFNSYRYKSTGACSPEAASVQYERNGYMVSFFGKAAASDGAASCVSTSVGVDAGTYSIPVQARLVVFDAMEEAVNFTIPITLITSMDVEI